MSPSDRVLTAFREHSVALPAVSSAGRAANPDDDTERHTKFVNGLQIATDSKFPQIVGLGEATHGTRECFLQKARLIRHLVVDGGFQTVAFEVDAARATQLDAFVRAGSALADVPPDATSALAELDMWQWQTETVSDLLTWLREFNASRDPAARVRVRGVDLSTPAAPARPLGAFFECVDPDAVESAAFRTVADATVPEDESERERTLDAVSEAAEALSARLERNRQRYVAASAETAWTEARHLCRVVEQACEWAQIRHQQPGPHAEGMATRDRFMAENALWALKRDDGNGVALWAHDGHIKRGTFDDGSPWTDTTTMGDRLGRELGDGYRPIGYDFARGSFRAVSSESGEVETFTVGDPPADSATAAFDAVDEAPFLLDLRAATADDRLGPWLAEKRRTRYVGSVFDPAGGEDAALAETDLAASFDYLLVLPESTATEQVG